MSLLHLLKFCFICEQATTHLLAAAQHSAKLPCMFPALQDALSLLAYEEPEASPCGELLGAKAREDVAGALSAALLAHSGRSAQSALERCLAQLARPCAAQSWECFSRPCVLH